MNKAKQDLMRMRDIMRECADILDELLKMDDKAPVRSAEALLSKLVAHMIELQSLSA